MYYGNHSGLYKILGIASETGHFFYFVAGGCMVRNYVSKNETMLREVFDSLRNGCSLYQACEKVKISTGDFYEIIGKNENYKERYLCSLADYADRCVDDIRKIVEELKEGRIDNSTAKLLIETMKWLVSKAKNDVDMVLDENGEDDEGCLREIVVKFI